jgi:hypothetical protein
MLIDWCRANDQRARRHLGGVRPIDLFVTEQQHLRPLPLWVPEVYQIHHRTVDEQGYVHLHTNRYSAPTEMIDRQVELHESKDRVRIFSGHREICIHERCEPGRQQKRTLPEHEHRGREKKLRERRRHEVIELGQAGKEVADLVEALEKRYGRRAWQSIRRLHRLYLDYPDQALLRAAAEALRYGLLDIARIEKMVLRNIADDFFPKLARRIRDDEDPEGDDG